MILDRIKLYIDAKGISISAFEKSVGMSNASFSKAIKNNGAIGTDKLENILSVYSDLSSEWLLTGKGNMLKGEEVSTISMDPKKVLRIMMWTFLVVLICKKMTKVLFLL